ncbi:MAG: basic amino acid ABC transporter substrate-binding protein [Syntrophomonadaceae bacterium]|jgi:glutamine transport system substrate-binding protein
MKKTVKLLVIGMLILGLLSSIAGCGGKQDADQDTAKQKEKPQLLVASETTYPPFEFSQNGELTGFDMDLIRAIGEVQGYDVKISTLGFDALIPALKADKYDCVISAMTITEDRKKSVDFSEPYFDSGLVIAVAQDNNDIKSLEDLKGKRLAGEVGTTGLNAENEIKAQDPTTQVAVFDAVGEAFMELQKGGADAVINDLPVTAYYIKTTGKDKIKIVGDVFSTGDQYGIAVKKGDTETLKMINDGLAKVKANGEYDKIYTKWFGEKN